MTDDIRGVRVIGYITPKSRATVYEFDGTYTVVVDCRHACHFRDFDMAEGFAAGIVAGNTKHRMGV